MTGPSAPELATVAWERFRPELVVAIDMDGTGGIPLLEHRYRPDETLAYLCERFVCEAPVVGTEALREALDR